VSNEEVMRRHLRVFVIAAALISPLVMVTGCATHVAVGYRTYDPYYRDYHVWNDNEIVYYNQWVVETHRPRRDFRRLRRREQQDYWRWRHSRTGRR
jgi:hypothetical protein